MRLVHGLALLGLLPAGGLCAGGGETPDAKEIVEKANRTAYYQGKDGRAEVTMTITDRQERTRTRRFTILRRDAPAPDLQAAAGDADAHCGDQKFYVYFHEPADVAKMVFMVWKRVGQDDDRWLYAPGLDLVTRIAASDERTSFVGSDFFYEDVSGRSPDEDSHELVETTDNYYVLKSTPRDPRKAEFAHYKSWIVRSNFLPRQIEYYDAKGGKYREYKVEAVRKIQDFWTVTKSTMADLRSGSRTVLEYGDVRYNIDVPEDVFTERYLKTVPRKYLK